jgi:subtilisin family serine protease
MAAGDKSAIQTAVTDTGDAVVVQASSKDNTFDSHHTLIRNDPAAAPGAAQPAVIKGAYNASHDGSSFSTPLWSSAIAMVIAFNPSLTAPQANNIILNTGTVVGTISGATWHAVIPNFRAAISSALSMPDKKHH